MSDSRIHVPPAVIASGASFAGTCLTQTPIFTSAPFPSFEDQRGVGAAETKGIRERVMHLGLARVVRDVVQIARGIRILVVDGRWKNLVAQGQHADTGL